MPLTPFSSPSSQSSAIARMAAATSAFLLFASAGCADSSPPTTTTTTTTATTTATTPATTAYNSNAAISIRDQIEALEKSGKLPPLDRSSSILGPDVNQNGVRDDIEAFINALGLTPVQTKAAMQKARALQKTLAVDTTDKDAVQKVGEGIMASTSCIWDHIENATDLSRAIESKTANTRERVKKYLAYNAARSGSVTTLRRGDLCEK